MHIDLWLQEQLQKADKNSLYCLDENSPIVRQAFAGRLLTNRFDLYQQALSRNYNVIYNDFDFSAIEPASLDKAIFRIGKDKILNIHLIKNLLNCLNQQGQLVLLGARDEGIESLIKLIKTHTDANLVIEKRKQQYCCLIGKPQQDNLISQYQNWQTFENKGQTLFSKPGIFGWQKIDKGSQLLIQLFSQQETKPQARLLDLGCGYGYLAACAKALNYQHIDATDNNAASVLACKKNFKALDIDGIVSADDCGQNIQARYDIILCNPPFHQGFSHHKDLTELFCQQASRLLKPEGQAYFVVNQFIGLEKYASQYFKQYQLLAAEQGFKVFLLEKR